MRLLLEKFRIPVSDVVVIHDMTHPPSKQTKTWFDNLTSEFVRKDDDPSNADSNSELSYIVEDAQIETLTINLCKSSSDQRVRAVGPEAQNV
jgi:hypothetical protein